MASDEGPSEELQASDAEWEARYGAYLEQAMNMIRTAADFGAASEQHDIDRWRTQSDPDDDEYTQLVLRSGVRPSVGIQTLFDTLDLWAFDCAESIQAARWYAELAMSNARQFDERYAGRALVLKQHDSTGQRGGTHWTLSALYQKREDPLGGRRLYATEGYSLEVDRMAKIKPNSRLVVGRRVDIDEVLADAPIGSRVMLHTFDSRVGQNNDYKNENSVKVGSNRYAAHPLGVGSLAWLLAAFAKYHVSALDENSTFWGTENEVRTTPRHEYQLEDDEVTEYAHEHVRVVEVEPIALS